MFYTKEFNLYRMDLPPYKIVTQGISFRGPAPAPGPYCVCIGSSFTFGRYVAEPFPSLLQFPAMNFGYGRLKPKDLLYSVPHMRFVRNAAFAVVQVSSQNEYPDSLDLLLREIRVPKILVDIGMGALDRFITSVDRGVVIDRSEIKLINDFYPDQDAHRLIADRLNRAISEAGFRFDTA